MKTVRWISKQSINWCLGFSKQLCDLLAERDYKLNIWSAAYIFQDIPLRLSWVCSIQHLRRFQFAVFLYSAPVTSCSNQPSDCWVNISCLQQRGSSSCHGLRNTPSASIISALLQCRTCSFISHMIVGTVNAAAGRAPSPTSLSSTPRCGTLPYSRKLHAS